MRAYSYDESLPVGGRVHGRRHRSHRHREARRLKKMARLQAAYPTVVGRPRHGILFGSSLAFLLGAGAIGYTIFRRRGLRKAALANGISPVAPVTGYSSGIATGIPSSRIGTTGIASRGIATSGISNVGTTTAIPTSSRIVNNVATPITTGITPTGVPIRAKRGLLSRLLPFRRVSPLKSSLGASPLNAISTPGMSIPSKRSKLPFLLLPLLALGGLAFGLKKLLTPREPKPVIVQPAAPATIVHQPAPVAVPAPVPAPTLVKKRRLPLLRIRKTQKLVPVQQTVVEEVHQPIAQVQPVARPIAVKHHVKTLYPAVEEFSTDEEVPVRMYGRAL